MPLTSNELYPDPGNGGDNNVRLKNWPEEGPKRLEAAREALKYLCEPVLPPPAIDQYLHYFCGLGTNPNALSDTEARRISLHKTVATLPRAYASVAQDLAGVGYSTPEADVIKNELNFYEEVRSAVKMHSGEELDIKPYEADMRHLINTYIQADEAETLGELGDMSLTEAIIETGIHDAIARKLNARDNLSNNAVAEGIINNVRKTIVRLRLTDPKFYEEMSALLQDLIQQRRENADEYRKFLRDAEALAKKISTKGATESVPAKLHGRREATVVYRNLPQILKRGSIVRDEDQRIELALEIDHAMREQALAGWRGDQAKEAQVQNALFPLLERNPSATLALFELVKNQPGY